MMEYEYLVATFILALIWAVLFISRKDLRKPMLWSGLFYLLILTVGFFAHSLIASDPLRSVTPGYWAPKTLFDLGAKTGGYAIEDMLFMFFVGGIASALYEFFFSKRIVMRRSKAFQKGHAIWVAIIGMLLFHQLFYLNDMYLLITFNTFGAAAVLWKRRDLVEHSLIGGFLFLAAYILGFLLMLQIFPTLVSDIYRLHFTSGVILLGIPFEEFLYGFTFGMLWAPLYEYEHRVRVD